MFKESVVLLTEAGETKSAPLPPLSLLQACHVAERLLILAELSVVMREDSHVNVFPGSCTLLCSQTESILIGRDSEGLVL